MKIYINKLFFIFTWIAFLISLQLWTYFDRFSFKFQYLVNNTNTIYFNYLQIEWFFGLDGISILFIVLTTFILLLSIFNILQITIKNTIEYLFYFFLIEIFLLATFGTLDLFLFFIFFESILIPMYIIIGKWGSRERKIKANYYFFIYTLLGSVFLLFIILSFYFETGSTLFCMLYNVKFELFKELFFWVFVFMAFAVKVPVFPFHLWLPEAHVEAPTAGSVVLAALLLKLGGYGFYRILLPCFTFSNYYYAPIIYTLCLISVINASFTAIRQTDLKRIIAYSSIAHMNFGLLGLFSLNVNGLQGCLFLMLAHGIVSAALFFLIGILYDKYHTRNLFYFGGLVQVMPCFSAYFLLFSFANIALPGTCNFIGEFLVMLAIIDKNFIILILACINVILCVAYTMGMFNKITFGNLKKKYNLRFNDILKKDHLILLPLSILTILFGIIPNTLLNTTYNSVWFLTQLINQN